MPFQLAKASNQVGRFFKDVKLPGIGEEGWNGTGRSHTMAEIIDLREIQAARRRTRRGFRQRESLERAVELFRINLADLACRLRDAPAGEQSELLDRIEKLAQMIRYGLLMLGHIPPAAPDDSAFDIPG